MGENVVLVYLVVCFFVFLAGFVDSIAGGGGLISLPAYMIAGLPVHTAIATNKMSGERFEDCHADRAADNFVLCSEEQRA